MFQDGVIGSISSSNMSHEAGKLENTPEPFPSRDMHDDLSSDTGRYAQRSGRCPSSNTTSDRFLLSDFRHSLTLFSKFFASFPHGTCSLSVSHPYLALDGVYHPLELHSQATRLIARGPYDAKPQAHTGLSPSCVPCSKGLLPEPRLDTQL